MSLLHTSFGECSEMTQYCEVVDCCGKGHSCSGTPCGALGLGAAMCRDCRGLSPLLRNVMCVLLVRPLGRLRVQPTGNCTWEVTVNKSPALISVSCICFQIKGLVFRSNTSGFYSQPLKWKVKSHPSHTSNPVWVSVFFCSFQAFNQCCLHHSLFCWPLVN